MVAGEVEDCVLHWRFGAFSFWFEVGAVSPAGNGTVAASPGRSRSLEPCCTVAGAERRRARENHTIPEVEIKEA